MLVKSNRFYVPTCDRCRTTLRPAHSAGQALACAREAGWKIDYAVEMLLCDKCLEKQNKRVKQ